MVTKEDLKQIVMLTYLTDSMLDQLAHIIDILKFDHKYPASIGVTNLVIKKLTIRMVIEDITTESVVD